MGISHSSLAHRSAEISHTLPERMLEGDGDAAPSLLCEDEAGSTTTWWSVADIFVLVVVSLPPRDQLSLRLVSCRLAVAVNVVSVEACVDSLLPLLLSESSGRISARAETQRLRFLPRVNRKLQAAVKEQMEYIASDLLDMSGYSSMRNEVGSSDNTEILPSSSTAFVMINDAEEEVKDKQGQQSGQAETPTTSTQNISSGFKLRAYGADRDGNVDQIDQKKLFEEQFPKLMQAVSETIEVESLVKSDDRYYGFSVEEGSVSVSVKRDSGHRGGRGGAGDDEDKKKPLFAPSFEELSTAAKTSLPFAFIGAAECAAGATRQQTNLRVSIVRGPLREEGGKRKRSDSVFQLDKSCTTASVCPGYHANNSSLKVVDFPFTAEEFRSSRIGSSAEQKNSLSVTEICSEFLYNARSLSLVDLGPLRHIQFVGDSFLERAESLVAVDVSPLQNLKMIGNSFLALCHSLAVVNLDNLVNVSVVGNNFLSHCTALRWVSVRGLSNLELIGDEFLAHSSQVQQLELKDLRKLKAVGRKFLESSQQIKRLDLSGMSGIYMQKGAVVNSKDLRVQNPKYLPPPAKGGVSSSSATTDNRSEIQKVKYCDSDSSSVCEHFLSDCYSLEEIVMPFPRENEDVTSSGANFDHITALGDQFLYSASALKAIDLRPFRKVSFIGAEFLSGASFITHIDTTGLVTSLREISRNFLKGCRSLQTVNLSGLKHVKVIPPGFLSYCASLKTIDLSPLESVVEIHKSFLSQCNALEDISSLKEIGPTLEHLDIRELLSGCRMLREVDLSALRHLKCTLGGAVSHVSHGGQTKPSYARQVDLGGYDDGSEWQKKKMHMTSHGTTGTGLIGCRNLRVVYLPLQGSDPDGALSEDDFTSLPPGCKAVFR